MFTKQYNTNGPVYDHLYEIYVTPRSNRRKLIDPREYHGPWLSFVSFSGRRFSLKNSKTKFNQNDKIHDRCDKITKRFVSRCFLSKRFSQLRKFIDSKLLTRFDLQANRIAVRKFEWLLTTLFHSSHAFSPLWKNFGSNRL